MPSVEHVPEGFFVGRKKYRYRVDGEPTRSVTEILEYTFGKGKFGAGGWWGMQQGVNGFHHLLTETHEFEERIPEPDEIVELLKLHKRTTNHVRDKAADRGSAVHDAADLYATEAILPDPQDFHPDDRGYVRALSQWITEYDPDILATEVVVGSAVHGYAGKYDFRAVIGDRAALGDYKTGKRLYEQVFFQLEGYEVAAIECGALPTDFRVAVHLGADGEFSHEESRVTAEQWLCQVAAYKAQIEAIEARKLARVA